jgi:hypothetical protein
MSDIITAVELARQAGVEPKAYRAALRKREFAWHLRNHPWSVKKNGPEHVEMVKVLRAMKREGHPRDLTDDARHVHTPALTESPLAKGMSKDEAYIIDLCDSVLGRAAMRQYRGLLKGDPGSHGRRAALPVDAFYPDLNLVIEFHEVQHTKSVRHFDKPNKITVSGVHRGEQRRKYDELRRRELPAMGIHLVELDYSMFRLRGTRLRRDTASDEAVIRSALSHLT